MLVAIMVYGYQLNVHDVRLEYDVCKNFNEDDER